MATTLEQLVREAASHAADDRGIGEAWNRVPASQTADEAFALGIDGLTLLSGSVSGGLATGSGLNAAQPTSSEPWRAVQGLIVEVYAAQWFDKLDGPLFALLRRTAYDATQRVSVLIGIVGRTMPQVLQAVETLGGTIEQRLPVFNSLSASIPLGAVPGLARVPEIRAIELAEEYQSCTSLT